MYNPYKAIIKEDQGMLYLKCPGYVMEKWEASTPLLFKDSPSSQKSLIFLKKERQHVMQNYLIITNSTSSNIIWVFKY